MRVVKWGNSLAIRLPAAVVEALGLKEGDDIEIQVAGARAFEIAKAPDARDCWPGYASIVDDFPRISNSTGWKPILAARGDR